MNYSTGGNLIDDNWIGREYEWDQFNRMTMVKNGSGTPLYGFEYGATGERAVQNTYAGGLVSSTRTFLYDREDVVVEYSDDQFSSLFRQYIHGPGIDEPLAILGDDPGEYMYYLEEDHIAMLPGLIGGNPCCPQDRISAAFKEFPEKNDELECHGLLVELRCLKAQFPNTKITTDRMDEIRKMRKRPYRCSRFE